MAKRFIGAATLILFAVLFSGIAISQEVVINCASLNLDRNTKTFSVAVNIINTTSIGGLDMSFTTGEIGSPFIIKPIRVDKSVSCIANWEYFSVVFSDEDSARVTVIAIANMPGGGNPPALPPGEGLLFDIIYEFSCDFTVDTALTITNDVAMFTDPSGYIIYESGVNHGSVVIGDDTAIRGDANCDGRMIGSDITYLIRYLENVVGCTCSLRAGDANSDGGVNIADVVFLKNYFNAEGPPPGQ